jgi:hypothetical protein
MVAREGGRVEFAGTRNSPGTPLLLGAEAPDTQAKVESLAR